MANLSLKKIQLIAIFFFSFILLATWNIPHTIAVRYISSIALFFFLALEKPKILFFLREQPILIFLIFYILLHTVVISDNKVLSMQGFIQEWVKFIYFSLLGTYLGFYLSKNYAKGIYLFLGIAFCAPLVIHLSLLIERSVAQGYLAYGYSGLSISHGDLGYAALQSSIFLTIYIFLSKTFSLKKVLGIVLLVFCFLSPYFSQSRGGLIFAFLSTLLVFVIYLINKWKASNFKKLLTAICLLALAIFIAFKFTSIILGEKWQDLNERINIGLLGNPIKIMCHGIDEVKTVYQEKYKEISPRVEKIISEIDSGTTSRVTVVRAGLELLIENPLGLYGSKEAYQIAISRKCTPTITMSNTHNGWLDLALALGIPGLLVFLCLYSSYLTLGIRALTSDHEPTSTVGLALSISVIIWFFRGLLDATSRDQMLEIQGFVMALMASLIFFLKPNKKETSP